jgi:hypothetical protein
VLAGSLLATAVLFGAPMVALGVASPMLVTRLARLRGAGRAAGSVLLAGTAGSVAGCYLTPLWLLPELGTRASLAVCAAGLVVAAFGVLATRDRTAARAVAA